jgi:large subunit ribosomal protein L25
MSDEYTTLKAIERNELGTNKVRQLRETGKVPAILYGHGEGSQPLSLDYHDLEVALIHGERLLELDLNGKIENALIKEVQYDAFGNDILHIDLARVNLEEVVEVTVPIVLHGTPAGTKDGGVLQQNLNELTISCKVKNIPDEISQRVTEMELNDRLFVRELELPEGSTLATEEDLEEMVATCSIIEEEVIEEPEEGVEPLAAEPEVIGEKEDEETEAPEGEETPE